ncbi:universal stress protein [Xylophilus sp. GW821-FHT01B05]
MFKHILVAVDGSDTAQQAVAKAAGLAKAFGSEVSVVYVIDPYPFTGVGTDLAYGQDQYLSAATNEANSALEAAQQLAAKQGVDANVMVVEGHAVHRGIVETADSVDADLIVMGSHGRKGLEKLVLGSVTQRVLGDVHIPVLVVRD